MFNSASPYSEGRKDGFAKVPANRGYYDDLAWADYSTGYADGQIAREQHYAALAKADDAS